MGWISFLVSDSLEWLSYRNLFPVFYFWICIFRYFVSQNTVICPVWSFFLMGFLILYSVRTSLRDEGWFKISIFPKLMFAYIKLSFISDTIMSQRSEHCVETYQIFVWHEIMIFVHPDTCRFSIFYTRIEVGAGR